MTKNFDKEKYTKFVSEKLKSAKSFKVEEGVFGIVQVYVHKTEFSFFTYRDGSTRIEARLELKFRQIAEPRYARWNSAQRQGRRRNDSIRHNINWLKDNDISTMCKIFGITYINIVKITESKSKKPLI